jgi:hypothetical protein
MLRVHDSALALRYDRESILHGKYIALPWYRLDYDYLLIANVCSAVGSGTVGFRQNETACQEPPRDVESLAMFPVGMKFHRVEVWDCPQQMHAISEHHSSLGQVPFLSTNALTLPFLGRVKLDN